MAVIATDVQLSSAFCKAGGRLRVALFLAARVTTVGVHLYIPALRRIFMWDELKFRWDETQTYNASVIFAQIVLTIVMTHSVAGCAT